jgi:hypothetical protein
MKRPVCKGEVAFVHGMKVYKRSRGVDPIILSFSTRRRLVTFTPRPLYPRDGTLLTNGWAPGLVGKFWRIENPFKRQYFFTFLLS